MLEWHETPAGLGPAAAGPFRFSQEGTRKRAEARAASAAVGTALTALLVVAGYIEAGWIGAAAAAAGAVAVAWALRRVERSYFTRIVPAVEVHEEGLCFCDTQRGVQYAELSGILVGKGSVFLAFKRGLDASRDRAGKRVPLWERAVRRKAYWEVPLDGFADAESVVKALTHVSGLPVREVPDDVAAALQSRAAQGIARVPAATVEFRF